ncbi:hypothetical protein HU200_018896 [Digitaria exilis]|uniref:DUF1618 domain-containing protein n=1 Tax=Digitaria exilis TaxID=1010633 RepID=A0A835KIK1_9POAL|nr:hypothetical protein HU200_018896 [Digitaria exilis]
MSHISGETTRRRKGGLKVALLAYWAFPSQLGRAKKRRSPNVAAQPYCLRVATPPNPHQIVNLDPLGRSRTPLPPPSSLPYSPAAASVSPSSLARYVQIPQPSLIFLIRLKVVMSAAAFPNWAILEPFVFRRDDPSSFPDKTKAPIRASATTSLGAPFRIAFSFAEPPHVSRLYAQLPGFPGPDQETPLAIILSTHRHLVLLRVATQTSTWNTVQDFFIYSADDPSELLLLPPCTEPYMEYTRRLVCRLPRCLRRRPLSTPREEEGPPARPRRLGVTSMGLVSRGEGEQDFAVVELKIGHQTSRRRREGQIAGEWDSMRVPIVPQLRPRRRLAALPMARQRRRPCRPLLCWIDYFRGILFCDVFGQGPTPTTSSLQAPPPAMLAAGCTRNVTPIDDGRALKFIDVARNDRVGYGALRFGGAFTITCHTLQFGQCGHPQEEHVVQLGVAQGHPSSPPSELWAANPPRACHPHIVYFLYFLFSDYKYVLKKVWLVAIDMNTKIVESFSKYVNGRDDAGTVDADLTMERSTCPTPFLPFDFPKYLNLSR